MNFHSLHFVDENSKKYDDVTRLWWRYRYKVTDESNAKRQIRFQSFHNLNSVFLIKPVIISALLAFKNQNYLS